MPAVEMLVLEFPSSKVDGAMVDALVDAVEQGQVIILDLVYLVREDDGSIRVIDIDEELDEHGFGQLVVARAPLLSDEDLLAVREGLTPGTSAAVIVYELAWSRRILDAVDAAGGQVALHVQVPVEAVETAIAMAVG